MSNMLTHNRLDGFFTEALMKNKPKWDMETIRTAALICSNALLLNSGYSKDVTPSEWVNEFLDRIGREVAVMGLHNHGYSMTTQKYLSKEGQKLTAYIEELTNQSAPTQSAEETDV